MKSAMGQARQLSAIMFADVEGYTALMQEDEFVAMRLREKMQTALQSEIGKHYGQVHALRGDGALCCFNSTLEAVNAAIALQLLMQSPPLVPLRIAIHTGDVINDGESIYGDGVNIASRLESFAVPGSIFISAKVYDDIKNQKDISAVSLGKFSLKNVKEQLEIFAISNNGLVIPDASTLEGKGEKVLQKHILGLPHKKPGTRILLLILSLFIPPLSVYLHEGIINNRFWMCLLFTFLVPWIGGIIYAGIIIFGNK